MLSLIPISDSNPTRRFPIVTVGLILANIFFFFFVEPGFGDSSRAQIYFFANAPVPCQLPGDCPAGVRFGPQVVPIPDRNLFSFLSASVFSTFLHAGFLHIIGNMLFLWIFGNNVEDFVGRVRYLLFYLAGGLAATFTHVFTHIDSFVPGVGASGAVAAVMGAYLLLYPRARVRVLVPIFILFTVVQLSAWVVLLLWFAYQFFLAYQELVGPVGVAWAAHAGGFVFGLVAIVLLGGRPQRTRPVWQPEWRGR